MIQAQFTMKIDNNQVIVKLFVLTAVFWKAVATQSTGKLHLG